MNSVAAPEIFFRGKGVVPSPLFISRVH